MPAEPAAEAEDNRITPIAAHPRFMSEAAPAVDIRAIEALRAAGGGVAFVRELVDSFRADAGELLKRLDKAVAAADAPAFARGVTALRRCAGHLGARRFYDALLSPVGITDAELRERGAVHIQRLTEEVDRLAAALSGLLPETGASQS
jgi:hypothetical protein